MNWTPVERRDLEEATPYLDDSPVWWNALLLPPLVVALTFGLIALTIYDWLRRLVGRGR